MINQLELMNMQAEALFVHDNAGRITTINEPVTQPAPRFFWGHTSMGQVPRLRHDVPERVVNEILQLMDRNDGDKIAAIIRILEKEEQIKRVWIGPAYLCHEVNARPSNAELVTERNRYRLEAGFSRLASELPFREPCYMMVENDMAVSVCFSARSTDRAAEAGVETLEGYRGKGYAITAVSSWCRAIRESRRIPFYSTSWDNYASQSIAKRLNLYHFGTDVSFY